MASARLHLGRLHIVFAWRAGGRRIASHSFASARANAAPEHAAASSHDASLLLTLVLRSKAAGQRMHEIPRRRWRALLRR
jgi:hypothetical protein